MEWILLKNLLLTTANSINASWEVSNSRIWKWGYVVVKFEIVVVQTFTKRVNQHIGPRPTLTGNLWNPRTHGSGLALQEVSPSDSGDLDANV